MNVVDLPMKLIFMSREASEQKLDEGTVKYLMQSIADVGLRHPLIVKPARKYVAGTEQDAYEINSGNHRWEALRRLERETAPCEISTEEDLKLELIRLDENLCRRTIGAVEQARGMARRKELYESLHPETVHGAVGGGHPRKKQSRKDCDSENHNKNNEVERFSAATAKALQKSERAIQAAAERGQKIAPDVLNKVQGTVLETGQYLDELKVLPPDKQDAKLERDLAKQAKKAASKGKAAGGGGRGAGKGKPKKPKSNKAVEAAREEARTTLRQVADILLSYVAAAKWSALIDDLEKAGLNQVALEFDQVKKQGQGQPD